VSDVDDDDPPGPPERRVRISPERAAVYGADTRGLGLALQAALEGIRAASFRRGNDEVEIIVKLPEHERQGGGFELERLAVPARIHGRTRLVPLSEVADIEEARGRATVRRRNRQHSITVTAEVDESATTPALVQAGVDDLLAGDVGVAQGSVSPHVAGKSEELDQVFSSMLWALGVALLFIYFQLGTLFRSFVQPVAILFTVPVAIVGVVLGFLVSGRPLDMLSMVGTVALSGIVVNDSLVLVEFINARRRGGAERWEAILEAGEARFRPIILTTVTTVGGLLPLALTATGQAAVLASMAHAICWGLSLATGLTLLVIPCAYAVADDFSNYCTRWWAGR